MDEQKVVDDIIPEEQRVEEHPEKFLVYDDGTGNMKPIPPVNSEKQ